MINLHASQIIFEDEYILVVNKMAGLMVEPDRNNHPNLLNVVKNYLKNKVKSENVYVQHLHRLDRPVSGIVLFTKDKSVLKNLSEQFAERRVSKKYVALTEKAVKENTGTISTWIRKEKKKAVLTTEDALGAQFAQLNYSIKSLSDEKFLWEIDLLTGKYHQIRFQLAYIGCPIIGDQLYGSSLGFEENRIALHAYQLEINHPVTNERMAFHCTTDWFINT